VRTLALAVGLCAAVALGTAVAHQKDSEPKRIDAARLMNELMTGKGPIGGPFALHDQHGQRVGPAQWRGKVVLMYFGYTSCPDACPTDLNNIAAAIEILGPDGSRVQPVFVTLDPQRDTPEVIGLYVKNFNPRFVALGGSESEIRQVSLSYKVFYEKVPQHGSERYVIDHTSFTYLLNAEGKYVGYFPPGTSGQRMSEQVKVVLAAHPP
jgi:cytochrome oxidase Cu insertion factor (SCO1/SenC/PrrC family)